MPFWLFIQSLSFEIKHQKCLSWDSYIASLFRFSIKIKKFHSIHFSSKDHYNEHIAPTTDNLDYVWNSLKIRMVQMMRKPNRRQNGMLLWISDEEITPIILSPETWWIRCSCSINHHWTCNCNWMLHKLQHIGQLCNLIGKMHFENYLLEFPALGSMFRCKKHVLTSCYISERCANLMTPQLKL